MGVRFCYRVINFCRQHFLSLRAAVALMCTLMIVIAGSVALGVSLQYTLAAAETYAVQLASAISQKGREKYEEYLDIPTRKIISLQAAVAQGHVSLPLNASNYAALFHDNATYYALCAQNSSSNTSESLLLAAANNSNNDEFTGRAAALTRQQLFKQWTSLLYAAFNETQGSLVILALGMTDESYVDCFLDAGTKIQCRIRDAANRTNTTSSGNNTATSFAQSFEKGYYLQSINLTTGHVISEEWTTTTYTPVLRPWYNEVQHRRGAVAWTEQSRLESTNLRPVIDINAACFSPQAISNAPLLPPVVPSLSFSPPLAAPPPLVFSGVISFTFRLAFLSDYLLQIARTPNTHMVLVDNLDFVLASTDSRRLPTSRYVNYTLMTASTSADNLRMNPFGVSRATGGASTDGKATPPLLPFVTASTVATTDNNNTNSTTTSNTICEAVHVLKVWYCRETIDAFGITFFGDLKRTVGIGRGFDPRKVRLSGRPFSINNITRLHLLGQSLGAATAAAAGGSATINASDVDSLAAALRADPAAHAIPSNAPEQQDVSFYASVASIRSFSKGGVNAAAENNMRWRLLTITPEEDITGEITRGRDLAILVVGCVIVGCMGIVLAVTWALLRPITAIAAYMHEAAAFGAPTSANSAANSPKGSGNASPITASASVLASGALDTLRERPSRLAEVQQIQTAFIVLYDQIMRARQFLPATLLAAPDEEEEEAEEEQQEDVDALMLDPHGASGFFRSSRSYPFSLTGGGVGDSPALSPLQSPQETSVDTEHSSVAAVYDQHWDTPHVGHMNAPHNGHGHHQPGRVPPLSMGGARMHRVSVGTFSEGDIDLSETSSSGSGVHSARQESSSSAPSSSVRSRGLYDGLSGVGDDESCSAASDINRGGGGSRERYVTTVVTVGGAADQARAGTGDRKTKDATSTSTSKNAKIDKGPPAPVALRSEIGFALRRATVLYVNVTHFHAATTAMFARPAHHQQHSSYHHHHRKSSTVASLSSVASSGSLSSVHRRQQQQQQSGGVESLFTLESHANTSAAQGATAQGATADFASRYAKIVEAITAAAGGTHRGILDSFHGDRFVVTFNAGRPCANHAVNAVASTKALFQRLHLLLTSASSVAAVKSAAGGAAVGMSSPGSPASCQLTCGIASGLVTVGNFGSATTRRFCTVGPAFSKATALERLCHVYSNRPLPPIPGPGGCGASTTSGGGGGGGRGGCFPFSHHATDDGGLASTHSASGLCGGGGSEEIEDEDEEQHVNPRCGPPVSVLIGNATAMDAGTMYPMLFMDLLPPLPLPLHAHAHAHAQPCHPRPSKWRSGSNNHHHHHHSPQPSPRTAAAAAAVATAAPAGQWKPLSMSQNASANASRRECGGMVNLSGLGVPSDGGGQPHLLSFNSNQSDQHAALYSPRSQGLHSSDSNVRGAFTPSHSAAMLQLQRTPSMHSSASSAAAVAATNSAVGQPLGRTHLHQQHHHPHRAAVGSPLTMSASRGSNPAAAAVWAPLFLWSGGTHSNSNNNNKNNNISNNINYGGATGGTAGTAAHDAAKTLQGGNNTDTNITTSHHNLKAAESDAEWMYSLRGDLCDGTSTVAEQAAIRLANDTALAILESIWRFGQQPPMNGGGVAMGVVHHCRHSGGGFATTDASASGSPLPPALVQLHTEQNESVWRAVQQAAAMSKALSAPLMLAATVTWDLQWLMASLQRRSKLPQVQQQQKQPPPQIINGEQHQYHTQEEGEEGDASPFLYHRRVHAAMSAQRTTTLRGVVLGEYYARHAIGGM